MNVERWQHAHSFGQEHRRPGESRTLIVIAITAAMMVVEIAAGIVYGSMALLADGLHMASHAAALGITAMAYIYARRHAHDARYSFGTGKVNALGGFTGAVLLGVFALMMGWQSVARLINPVDIAFNQAIFVAVLGLIVNGASIFILGVKDHDHDHGHSHGNGNGHTHGHGTHDHALRSAYFHVMADALTSLLAIFALLAAKYFGLVWMDPMMGIVGTILVSRWSFGLLRDTSKILLDRQGHDELCNTIRSSIEHGDGDGDEITDLHVWSVGPNIHAAIISLATKHPRPPDHYKALLPDDLGLVHVNIEVHHADEVTVSREDS